MRRRGGCMTADRILRTAEATASMMWTPTASSRPSSVAGWEAWEAILVWGATASSSLLEAPEAMAMEVTDRASVFSLAKSSPLWRKWVTLLVFCLMCYVALLHYSSSTNLFYCKLSALSPSIEWCDTQYYFQNKIILIQAFY